MTDVKVEQVDRDAAGALARFLGESEAHIGRIIAGELDHADIVIAFARHRQAAEKAQQERDAVYLERRGQQIMDGSDNVSTGNMMRTIYYAEATAIRSQGHE